MALTAACMRVCTLSLSLSSWTYETAVLLDTPVSSNIPNNDFIQYYGELELRAAEAAPLRLN